MQDELWAQPKDLTEKAHDICTLPVLDRLSLLEDQWQMWYHDIHGWWIRLWKGSSGNSSLP